MDQARLALEMERSSGRGETDGGDGMDVIGATEIVGGGVKLLKCKILKCLVVLSLHMLPEDN